MIRRKIKQGKGPGWWARGDLTEGVFESRPKASKLYRHLGEGVPGSGNSRCKGRKSVGMLAVAGANA
jgi:hypothetical protein